jgi:WS/DGAT/MGAT family acyltransferase
VDRLSSLDASFLYLDSSTPMHVGSLAIFDTPAGGFGYDTLLELVGRRLPLVPRYRQKVRQAPGKVTSPVWVDDPDFDLTRHVRLVHLTGPGSRSQLLDLVGRLLAERLDRSRPLWEIVLVEGLADGRFAIMSRTHQAMIDGSGAVDLTHVLLDAEPGQDVPPATADDDGWTPRPGPATGEMLAAGVADLVRRPWSAVETLRMAAEDSRATAGRVLGTVGGLWSAARTAARPAPASPLNPERPAAGRRFATAATDLDGYREVHKRRGSTVHDVALATITGALRTWLQHREAGVSPRAVVRALVPVASPVRTCSAAPSRRTWWTCRSVSRTRWSACTRSGSPSATTGRPASRWAPTRSSGSPGSRRPPCTRSVPGRPAGCRGGCSTWSSPTFQVPRSRSTRVRRGWSRSTRPSRSPKGRASRSG